MEKMRGRIVNIEKHQSLATYIKQGIKGPDQYKYDNYPGGNGTYVTGGEYYGTVLNVKIKVYDIDRSITFDVYEIILSLAGKKRISPQLLEVIESHEGDRVDVYTNDGINFSFDASVLLTAK
ncbi:hypothetical protein [Lacrimispora aerotolerans]|uniref:hypothetical protein n=1 Tax=Lacrimispora aerotolerans TaxID=36832 RepID=UPI00047CD02C|nr:hypothetical protein [Lacrimispora aerotolerans]